MLRQNNYTNKLGIFLWGKIQGHDYVCRNMLPLQRPFLIEDYAIHWTRTKCWPIFPLTMTSTSEINSEVIILFAVHNLDNPGITIVISKSTKHWNCPVVNYLLTLTFWVKFKVVIAVVDSMRCAEPTHTYIVHSISQTWRSSVGTERRTGRLTEGTHTQDYNQPSFYYP